MNSTKMISAIVAVASAAGVSSAGVVSLDLMGDSIGTIGGIGPRNAVLTFDPSNDGSRSSTMQLRMLNQIQSESNVTDSLKSIDGNVNSFARVGGASSGEPGDNDGIDGELNLKFDDGFTYNRTSKIVFDEFGSEDEPFSISVMIGGDTFEISSTIANTVDGVSETEVQDNGKIHRIYVLDLSGSYFDGLGGGTFTTFSILDDTSSTNLSPDVTFAAILVPLPNAFGLAGLGLLASAGVRRRR